MSAHALLAPSGAHIWAPADGCRAYPAMAARFPEPEDAPAAREGTAAHFYLTETLAGRAVKIGDLAPNGEPITAEMVDCAEDMLRDVRDTLAANPGAEIWIETPLPIAMVAGENWGTPDVVIVNRARCHIFLWDYKFGHGFVDAAENWQMLDYLCGVLARVAGAAQFWPEWKATLTVAQPRNFHALGPLREWQVSGQRMAREYLPRLRDSAFESLDPNAKARTGEHCRYCPARHACPALQAAAQIAVDVSRDALPTVLPPSAVGIELRHMEDAIKRLEARKTGLEEQALALVRAGQHVPNYSAEHATGREAWQKPPEEVFALGDMLGADLRKPPAPLTPAQARKALSAIGLDGNVMAGYSDRPRGAIRLVRTNDAAARLAFQQEKPESD